MITVAQAQAAGGFGVIYADPPWQYRNRTIRGGAENHYSTMDLAQICALPVPTIASPDSALFLWATWPLLAEALQVIKAWGFVYKTCAFDWVKTTKANTDAFGLGHWTRGNTEPCLLATRGRPVRVDAGVRQVIAEDASEGNRRPLLDPLLTSEVLCAPRGEHSAKPPEARKRIERLMGSELPALEMFARERAEGWEAWGNEVISTVDLTGGST